MFVRLGGFNAGNREAVLDFRLRAAPKAFYVTKLIFCVPELSYEGV